MTKFRVHYESGETIDLDAKDATDARERAKKRQPGIVTKVKVLKEKASA
jgi:hypothetical protein